MRGPGYLGGGGGVVGRKLLAIRDRKKKSWPFVLWCYDEFECSISRLEQHNLIIGNYQNLIVKNKFSRNPRLDLNVPKYLNVPDFSWVVWRIISTFTR